MKYTIALALMFVLGSCERRGDRSKPYPAKESVFSTVNPGNKTGTGDGTRAPSSAPGGSTSAGVTSGSPTATQGGELGLKGSSHESKADGANDANAGGSNAPGGGSASAPTAGGIGKPQEQKPK